MPFSFRVAAFGSVAIVLFDLVASLGSKYFGFPYARATIGSCLVYLAIGFLAARGADRNPVTSAALTAALAGVVEAAAGWAVSWIVGPGRLPDGASLTVPRWVVAVVTVAIMAAMCGAVGGFAGRRPPSAVAAV